MFLEEEEVFYFNDKRYLISKHGNTSDHKNRRTNTSACRLWDLTLQIDQLNHWLAMNSRLST